MLTRKRRDSKTTLELPAIAKASAERMCGPNVLWPPPCPGSVERMCCPNVLWPPEGRTESRRREEQEMAAQKQKAKETYPRSLMAAREAHSSAYSPSLAFQCGFLSILVYPVQC